MSTAVSLLKTLENLTSEEFEKFKWYLQQPNQDFPTIPVCRLEKADRMKTVDQMVKTYCAQCVEVTIKVLRMINRNDLLEELSKIASNPTALSSQSSSGTNQLLEGNKSSVEKLTNTRPKFIERTSDPNLNELLDKLLHRRVITDAEYEAVKDIKPRADKARDLIDMVRKKGAEASSKMINILSAIDPCLYTELGLN